jgi:sec-independent protein translocase protein TatC
MDDEKELTLWDHFEELSSRLRRVLFVLIVASVLIMSLPADPSKILSLDFSDYTLLTGSIIETLQNTLLPEGVTLIAFNWLDSFIIYVTVSFAAGFMICLPYVAYQIYGFLAPAIYENEKKTLFTFISVFVVLFMVGVAYAYYILLPTTFNVLYQFVYQTRVVPFYSVKDFFDMVVFGLFGSGLFYTFPLVIYLLVKMDLLEVASLKGVRRQLFVALAVVTAVLTPDPTPVSMLLMTIPFYIMYEVTIVILSYAMRDKHDKVILEGLRASQELLEKARAIE